MKETLESEEGKGARFQFTLPMSSEQEARTPMPAPAESTGEPEPHAGAISSQVPTPASTEPPDEAPGDDATAKRPRFRIIRREGS